MTDLLFLIHFVATWFMVGLIWFVQIVHYPLLGDISKYRTAAYEQTHMRLATWVFGPPMLVEMSTAVLLIYRPPTYFGQSYGVVGLALLLVVWLSTAFLQAPQHQTLATGYDEASHQFLMRSNWIRTILWSLRGALVLESATTALSLP